MKSCFELGRAKQLCTAILYLDVKTAYASVLMDSILPDDSEQGRSAYISKLVALGFCHEDSRTLHQDAANLAYWL